MMREPLGGPPGSLRGNKFLFELAALVDGQKPRHQPPAPRAVANRGLPHSMPPSPAHRAEGVQVLRIAAYPASVSSDLLGQRIRMGSLAAVGSLEQFHDTSGCLLSWTRSEADMHPSLTSTSTSCPPRLR